MKLTFDERFLSCHVEWCPAWIVILFLLRLIDGLLYLPSLIIWLLMMCPRDPQQVCEFISLFVTIPVNPDENFLCWCMFLNPNLSLIMTGNPL
jgi:hypothetical protein